MLSVVVISAALALALTALPIAAARLLPATGDSVVAELEKLRPRIQCIETCIRCGDRAMACPPRLRDGEHAD